MKRIKRLIHAVAWAQLLSLVESVFSLGLGLLLFLIEKPDVPIFTSRGVADESVLLRSLSWTLGFLMYRWVSLNTVAVAIYWYFSDVKLDSVRTTLRGAYMNTFLVVTIFASWSLVFDFLRKIFVVQKPFYANLGIYGLALSAFVTPILIWYSLQAYSAVRRAVLQSAGNNGSKV